MHQLTLSGTSSSNASANKTGLNWASTSNISVVGGGVLTMRSQDLNSNIGFNQTRAINQVGNGTLRLLGATSAFTATGLVGNESIGSVNLAFTDKNAGTNKTITIGAATAGTNTLLNNYDISYVNSTTSTITKLQLTTATGFTVTDKIYDGNTSATINKSGANFVGVLNGDQVTIANATGNFNNESVGTNKLVTIRNFVASGSDAGNYDVSNVSANAYANITANSSIVNFDSTSTETYSSIIKFTVLNSTFTQTDNLSYATYEQFGYPTFQDFILRKKTGEGIKKTIEISQSGVNKNIR